MTSLSMLTRHHCRSCKADTLHSGANCVHCGCTYSNPCREIFLDALGKSVLAEHAMRKPTRIAAKDRPCVTCKRAPREVGAFCKPCKKLYNSAYEKRRVRKPKAVA